MAMSISFRDIQAFTFTITRKILYYDPTGCGAPIPELEGFMLNLYGSFNKDTSNREIWLELAEIPFEFNETHVIVVEYVVHQFMLVVPDKGSLEDLDRKLDQFKRTAYKGGIRASQKIVYPFELGPGDEMAGN
nr:hypothetical protein [Candidatus Sigynarchaeota archaeon]